MPSEQDRPGENDAVLGGQNLIPRDAAVLGGIEGVKGRLASPAVEERIAALSEAPKYGEAGLDLIIGALQDDSVEVRIAALSEAPKYGDAGLDLILKALRNESMQVKLAAYSLLKDRNEVKIKQHLQNYFFTLFDVITVDSSGQESSRRKSLAFYFPEDLGNGIVLEMVYIPGGTFMMGSHHQVTISDFYAGKYPITQAQWQAVMGNNPSHFGGEKRPVEGVSWDDAVEFCSKLSEKTGNKYRLLSEAEWEYACRAGTTTPFYFGETITLDLVNHCPDNPFEYNPTRLYRRETTDVGSFPPNAFGLYDMHGNVWEWCSDLWHDDYNGAPTDGSSWETDGSYPLQRGGSWVSSAEMCRCDERGFYAMDHGWWCYGFRVAVENIKQHLQNYFFKFDVITVDSSGQKSSHYKSSALYFPEDLGNGIALEMVYIPGGTFMMGSPATESGRDSHESPQHEVTISAFYAGKYPITQAQWQAVMGNNPSEFKGEKRPVECVSWDDAVEFCRKLSEKTGNKYRLLSEAEWEYACRADTTTPFHFGETITPDLVNYDGNKPYANSPKGVYRQQTTNVGSFPPNAFGLYDMHGNVWEWCSDTWHDDYNGAPTDGSSWETGQYNKRVQRGGSWVIDAVYCRSADRVSYSADGWWKYRGFRVAVTSVSAPS